MSREERSVNFAALLARLAPPLVNSCSPGSAMIGGGSGTTVTGRSGAPHVDPAPVEGGSARPDTGRHLPRDRRPTSRTAPALDNGAEVLTYAEFAEAADEVARRAARAGHRRGDRVGVRIRSGTIDLYVAIIGILLAGAAYVPVDADDPDERARLVFGEAAVAAVIGNDLDRSTPRRPAPVARSSRVDPTPADDAWVIFTSVRPARRRASRSPIGRRPPSSTPRRACSSRSDRSARATG